MLGKNQELEVWKAYIEAIDIVTEKASEAFSMRIFDINSDNRLVGRFELNDQKVKIFDSLREVFTELQEEHIDHVNNAILYPSTLEINREGLGTLIDIATEEHFEFSDKASFSGVIKHLSTSNISLPVDNHPLISSTDVYFLTINEIEELDHQIKNGAPFERDKLIGAISTIQPGYGYELRQRQKLMDASEELGLKVSYNEEHYSVEITDVFLNRDFFEDIKNKFGFKNTGNHIVINLSQKGLERFRNSEDSKVVHFANEVSHKTYGLVLPRISEDGCMICKINPCSDYNEFYDEVSLFLKVLLRYFKQEDIHIQEVKSYYHFDLDIERFYESISDLMTDLGIHFNAFKKSVSFDFEDREGLEKIVSEIRDNELIHVPGFGADHKYKVYINKLSPLTELQKELEPIRYIKTALSKDADKLSVFGLSDDISQIAVIRANIENLCELYLGQNTVLEWDAIDRGYLKYFYRYDEKSYIEETTRKLVNLEGETIEIFPDRVLLGTVRSVNFPEITIDLLIDKERKIGEDLISETGTILHVKGILKGERDKIKRLRDTTDKLFDPKGARDCPNDKLRKALVQPDKLESLIDGEITYTAEYKEMYSSVNEDLLSPYINERQKESITKCLLAEDLFVIQGPPGTGKSTAIAELIWQHVKKHDQENKYRILVTSETNLAVDNAIDKLRSTEHMLVRPLRFGIEDKLDREGRKFSLEAIRKWKEGDHLTEEPLVTDDWVNMIYRRVNDENDPYLELWKEHLAEKDNDLRVIFTDAYINNCNVIGATCSSIGMLNSINGFTRFYQEYCGVFHPIEYQRLLEDRTKSNYSTLRKKGIYFDLVIQDEASKASPPELALPFLFGKKAVVIGDHRQLPPMIDTNEFIENLSFLRDKARERTERNRISQLIRFVKLHREDFDRSHFEKLFKGIHSNLRSTFDTQYRMHPAINETIKQFYRGDFENGRDLECGLPLAKVDSTDLNEKMSRYHGITKDPDKHVLWFNVETPEIKKGTSRINLGEAEAVNWILRNLTKTDGYKHFTEHWSEDQPEEREIGVITFYGGQAGLLKKNIPEGIPARVSPVDRFQGMERNIVIVSLVRSNIIAEREDQEPNYDNYPDKGYPANESLGFAESPNRLNVALSRAKRLLIIVGNRKHFERKEIYKGVVNTILQHEQCDMYDYHEGTVKRVTND